MHKDKTCDTTLFKISEWSNKENKSKIEVGVLLIAWYGPVDTGQIVTLSSHSARICFNGIHNYRTYCMPTDKRPSTQQLLKTMEQNNPHLLNKK